LRDLSIPPTLIVGSYKFLVAYGNRFRTSWLSTNTMVTYDYGVMGNFDQTPPEPNQIGVEMICYIGECRKILGLDYGLTKVLVLFCSWVQTKIRGVHAAMKRDKYGFLFVNFKQEQPFVFPFQAEHFLLKIPLMN
jgi:hypothetical protein